MATQNKAYSLEKEPSNNPCMKDEAEEIKRLRHCGTETLFKALDGCIREDKRRTYEEIKRRLSLQIRLSKNPFNAGASPKYSDREIQEMKQLHKDGKTYRQIAAEFHCSISTVSRLLKMSVR